MYFGTCTANFTQYHLLIIECSSIDITVFYEFLHIISRDYRLSSSAYLPILIIGASKPHEKFVSMFGPFESTVISSLDIIFLKCSGVKSLFIRWGGGSGSEVWEHDFKTTSDTKGPIRGPTFWTGFEATDP